MKALILIEHEHGQVNALNQHVAKAAVEFGQTYDALIVGHKVSAMAEEVRKYAGCDKVLALDDPNFENVLADQASKAIAQIAKDYQGLFAPSSTYAKDILPRVSALLDVHQLSDIVAIEDPNTFTRPIYAGNVYVTLTSEDPIKICTIRTSAFAKIAKEGQAEMVPLTIEIEPSKASFVKMDTVQSERPDLTSARRVVSGGRALKSAENFQLIEALADSLGADVGATRAAVDAGFVPNDYQVGQTGKIVSPELYIAVGISGAIQHLAGMKDSKVIVAINKDEDAPIFSIADYGLVGDLFEIVPQLTKKIQEDSKA